MFGERAVRFKSAVVVGIRETPSLNLDIRDVRVTSQLDVQSSGTDLSARKHWRPLSDGISG